MSIEPASAGDAIPPKCEVIEVRVAELRQLFNAIDPSPFRERDLDPRAAEFIVDWSEVVLGLPIVAFTKTPSTTIPTCPGVTVPARGRFAIMPVEVASVMAGPDQPGDRPCVPRLVNCNRGRTRLVLSATRPTNLLISRSHSTELAIAAQNTQSWALKLTVPNAR